MASQELPPKLRRNFADLLQHYEQKKLAEGRRIADGILKKFPDHGETMCMKGLIMVHTGDREQGIALVREGMRRDLTSHICWHVWALILKGEHNYEEALKAYTRALKLDKENFNILRETSVLQVHTRNYDMLVESRLTMLRLSPFVRAHWIGAILALRLAGNAAEAKRFLQHMDNFLRNVPERDVEYSEIVFFHIGVLEELGDWQEALALLNKKIEDRYLVDLPSIARCRARLFGKLKSSDSTQQQEWALAAEQAWRELIDQNPDSQDYYKGFLSNAGIDLGSLDDESREKALGILEEFSVKHPKTSTHRRLALSIAQGDRFKQLVKPYIQRAIRKGIPSLFSDLKHLYTDPFKLESIQEIIEDIHSSVTPNNQAQPSTDPEPTDYLWILYYLAQHYSALGQYAKSLEILHTAMEHTPTLPELYMTKARVLKRAGDPYGAIRALDDAANLDGQDRYVNTKAGKYRLRAGVIQEANETLSLFTKKDLSVYADLYELQALHYLTELGDAHRRLGQYHLALKTYYSIQKLFQSFREEQYDFHLYSIRKSMLSSYMSMLSWEDNLHSNPAYIHVAVWSARIWIRLYDNPSIINSLHPPEPPVDTSKKALNKAKKAAYKASSETSSIDDDASLSKGIRAKTTEDKGLEAPLARDDDPEGLKLIAADDPLDRANKFLGSLGEFAKDNLDVNVTVFDVAIRQKKYLKAARALHRAHERDPDHPEVHVRIVQLTKQASASDVAEPVKSVLNASLAKFIPADLSLHAFNSQYLQRRSTSGAAVLGAAKVLRLLDAPIEEVEQLLFTTLAEGGQLGLEDARSIVLYLQEIQSPRADEFRIRCDEKFKLSKVFKSAEEQEAMRRRSGNSRDRNRDEIKDEPLFFEAV